jgi:hypothetical protein
VAEFLERFFFGFGMGLFGVEGYDIHDGLWILFLFLLRNTTVLQ